MGSHAYTLETVGTGWTCASAKAQAVKLIGDRVHVGIKERSADERAAWLPLHRDAAQQPWSRDIGLVFQRHVRVSGFRLLVVGEVAMRTQTALKTLLAVAVAAVLTAASASATSTSAVACTLLSSSQLKSTLGLSQSTVLRNYDPTGAGSMAVDTECDWGVWSGAPPTSPAATFALARAGHAAQTGIETWAPHQGHERDWTPRATPS